MEKPMKLFYSPISHHVYASKTYKEVEINGEKFIRITGKKWDVTDDFMSLMDEQLATRFPDRQRS